MVLRYRKSYKDQLYTKYIMNKSKIFLLINMETRYSHYLPLPINPIYWNKICVRPRIPTSTCSIQVLTKIMWINPPFNQGAPSGTLTGYAIMVCQKCGIWGVLCAHKNSSVRNYGQMSDPWIKYRANQDYIGCLRMERQMGRYRFLWDGAKGGDRELLPGNLHWGSMGLRGNGRGRKYVSGSQWFRRQRG